MSQVITASQSVYSKDNPFPARVTEDRLLNGLGSAKDTRHFVVDTTGSGLSYTCGDSLGVFPINRPEEVDEILTALHLSGDEAVELRNESEPLTLRYALFGKRSLASPNRKFLLALRDRAQESIETDRLDELLDPANAAMLKQYLAERHFVDLLEKFPSARFQAQDFVEHLRRLVPRLYSIASSPTLYPDEVHLTVAIVRYRTNSRDRVGVCTTYLSDRIELNAPIVPVFVASSRFGLPADDSADLIMVGPGTGIAPFRAFLQERIASGASGRSWVFFGDQHGKTDYLYGDEFERHLQNGQLDRIDLAWSRDQDFKVYVQDRMREKAAELWNWLERGAYFYVCGDSKRMAPDVDRALHEIVAEHGRLDEADAKAFIKSMRKERRYQRDIY